jgi:predicted nuclease of predicted toxin-antitoxin system
LLKKRIIADESVDYNIVLLLRNGGFEVYAISEESPSISDINVLDIAVEHNALLITEDKDFGELVFRLNLLHKGILLIRILEKKIILEQIVKSIMVNYLILLNKFSVLTEDKLRIKE